MNQRQILITGGTGFVGTRLAERMTLGEGYAVSALVHRFSSPGIARLARMPVKLVFGDVMDVDTLTKAAEGCTHIVHLAYGTSGDSETQRKTTVTGTENVLRVALDKNIEKVIYFSTTAVYGPNPKQALIDESIPFEPGRDVYTTSKIEAENVVWNFHTKYGLPVVVLRPPLIYGPYGVFWTTRIVKEIQTGAILVNGGNGCANLIYVDNLIDIVLLAIEKKSGDGKAFITVDDEHPTWKEVYEGYGERIGSHPPMQSLTTEEIKALRKGNIPKKWLIDPFLLVPEMFRACFQSQEMRRKMLEVPWLKFIRDKISEEKIDRMKGLKISMENGSKATAQKQNHLELPNSDLVALYASQARFSNENVKKVLGYKQRITFQEALDLIHHWMRYQRLIS